MRIAGAMIAGACGLLLAGCMATGGTTAPGASVAGNDAAPAALERPGTRITVRNPEPGKWAPLRPPATTTAAAAQPQAGARRYWVCRPLACPGRAAVMVQLTQSPTRRPDRKALEKLAKILPVQARAQDMTMEAVSDGDERITPLSSRVADVRGYSAILFETKRTSRGKVSYGYRGDLFVGAALVRVVALATERAEARKHFEAFVEAMEIQDREGPADVAPPPPRAAAIAEPPEAR